MGKKLTLYLDEKIIEIAKSYSRDKNLSVSKIVASYFTNLKKQQSSEEWIDKWMGIANAENILKKRKGDKRLIRIYEKHVK